MPNETITEPCPNIIEQIEERDPEKYYKVVVWNNDHTDFIEVILGLMLILGVSQEHATHLTQTVHLEGKASVFYGKKNQCDEIASAIERIGVETTVEPCGEQ